jgi:1-acyl-sn-glycerol-3-phosphate acyltransferase
MRSQLNRIIVLVGLAVALPAISIGERLRAGAGRRLAVRAIKRITGLCGVHVEVHGADRLESGLAHVLVPNHTSPMDIPALLVAQPGVRFVAAAELFHIPLLASAMRAMGTVPIRRGDANDAHHRVAALSCPEAGRQLVMFPEGGIAPTSELLTFKSGAFVVAINSGAPVVPIAITGASQVLPPRGRLRVRSGTVHVHVLEPLSTDGLTTVDRTALASRAQTAVASALDRARTALVP